MKRVTVLKSLRTQAGAQDWLNLMGKQHPGAEIMDTATLKHIPDVAYTVDPTGFSSHVVVQEDLTPIIERISAGEIGELVKAFVDKGYGKIDNYGFSFSEKWYSALSDFFCQVFERGLETYKSTSKLSVPAEFTALMEAADGVLKALSADPMPTEPSVPEGTEASDKDNQAEAEAISDAEAEAAATKETPLPAAAEEHAPAEAVSETSSVDKVFKSLAEARAWDNPDVSKYYIDSMRFDEKQEFGVRYNYIVREKAQREPVGAFGNRLRR